MIVEEGGILCKLVDVIFLCWFPPHAKPNELGS